MSVEMAQLVEQIEQAAADEVDQYVAEAALKWRVKPFEVLGRNRARRVCRARAEVAYRLRQLTVEGQPLYSLDEIGDLIGGRDHSTVIWMIGAHEARMED